MSRKKSPAPAPASAPSPGNPNWPLVLVGLAAGETALAIFQWLQLVTMRAGGATVCGFTDAVSCDRVWNSGFASRIHDLVGVPVAGLGVAWGLAALGLSVFLLLSARAGKPLELPVLAVRLVGALGALSCLTFAVASFRAGAVCPLCLATYVVTLAFFALAFVKLPGAFNTSDPRFGKAVGYTAAAVVLGFLAVLGPGLATAKKTDPKSSLASAGKAGDLGSFIATLSPPEKQALAQSLAVYRSSQPKDVSRYPVRQRHGSKDAPVKVVDWVDIRCGHCAQLAETLFELKKVVPAEKLSVEPRHFPLDSECNPFMQHSDQTGIRCAGAKAQICLEGQPDYWELQKKLFENQESLTRDSILAIASSGSLSRTALDACIASPETESKLRADIAYAMEFNPEGTPVVSVNGRNGTPFGPFLFALSLVGGNPDAPEFASLPKPAAQQPGHEGHAH